METPAVVMPQHNVKPLWVDPLICAAKRRHGDMASAAL